MLSFDLNSIILYEILGRINTPLLVPAAIHINEPRSQGHKPLPDICRSVPKESRTKTALR